MVKIFTTPFAANGTKETINDLSQPDGKVSYEDGFTSDYELPDTDPNYKPIERSEFNGIMYDVTKAVGQVQIQGAAAWSPDGIPYPVNAQVYHNGKQWMALRANSVAPVEGEDWSETMSQKAVSDQINNTEPLKNAIETKSASFGVTYTNTSPGLKLIFVSVRTPSGAVGNVFMVYVGGEELFTPSVHGGQATGGFCFAVPSGFTYRVDSPSGATLNRWVEVS